MKKKKKKKPLVSNKHKELIRVFAPAMIIMTLIIILVHVITSTARDTVRELDRKGLKGVVEELREGSEGKK